MTDSRVLEELSEASRQKVVATGCPVHSLSEDWHMHSFPVQQAWKTRRNDGVGAGKQGKWGMRCKQASPVLLSVLYYFFTVRFQKWKPSSGWFWVQYEHTWAVMELSGFWMSFVFLKILLWSVQLKTDNLKCPASLSQVSGNVCPHLCSPLQWYP